MQLNLTKSLLVKLLRNDCLVTSRFQSYNRKTSLINSINHKHNLASLRVRKSETHTKFLLGGLVIKSELHLKFSISLGEDLTADFLQVKVDELLQHFNSLKQVVVDEQLNLPTLLSTWASKGAKLLASNSLSDYIKNDILPTENYSKSQTRTIIQLGGLVVKSGLPEIFNLKLGDRLQHDHNIRKNVNALFALLSCSAG